MNFDRRPVAELELVTMRDVMLNRGLEHGGQWLNRHVALGHRRLPIVDHSPLADQPTTGEDATKRVVFNGAIYNFPEIRKALEAQGHQFRSRSDAEVIVYRNESLRA